MKRQPIVVILARLKKMPLPLRVKELQRLVAAELPHSVRRNELQSLLQGAMCKLLRQESRVA